MQKKQRKNKTSETWTPSQPSRKFLRFLLSVLYRCEMSQAYYPSTAQVQSHLSIFVYHFILYTSHSFITLILLMQHQHHMTKNYVDGFTYYKQYKSDLYFTSIFLNFHYYHCFSANLPSIIKANYRPVCRWKNGYSNFGRYLYNSFKSQYTIF